MIRVWILSLVRWLLRFTPGYHLHRDPPRRRGLSQAERIMANVDALAGRNKKSGEV